MRNIYTLSPYFRWLCATYITLFLSLPLGQGYEVGGRIFDDSGKKIGVGFPFVLLGAPRGNKGVIDNWGTPQVRPKGNWEEMKKKCARRRRAPDNRLKIR